jgi:integrating conjugative element relaxase (TIGR03760 family)
MTSLAHPNGTIKVKGREELRGKALPGKGKRPTPFQFQGTTMFALFRRKTASPIDTPPPAQQSIGLLRPESAESLLATPRRRRLLEHIWQRTSLSRAQFTALYRGPIERYAALVQQFPASESHHHSHPGGMLDHGLEIVAYALKLRQSHLLPVGAPPEDQGAQAEAWTAGTAYGALLHDIGKIAVDLHVEYADGERWYPWHGKLIRPYRFRYRKDRTYRLHGAATGLLYSQILDTAIFDWLSGFPELWASLLYVLAGQYEHAGILGELVLQADQASVSQELGGDPAKARTAPKHALQRKLLDGLRYLLKEELKLNQPQASDGWLTQDTLWLVSKTVCDKLRAHLLSQGIEGIPSNNTAVFDVFQDHGIAQPTPEGKAIWKATVTSETGWAQSFTFLKVSPALIWEMGERPASFTGTVRVEETAVASADGNQTHRVVDVPSGDAGSTRPGSAAPSALRTDATDALGSALALLEGANSAAPESDDAPVLADKPDTELQSRSDRLSSEARPSTSPTAEDTPGMGFMTWLRNGILDRHIKINDAQALVHTVAGTAYLVSPGIFQRYVQAHPETARLNRDKKLADWEAVQKNFERLRLHKKQHNGLNIWSCEVTGPRKSRRLHGYLLADGRALFVQVPFDNPYLKLLTPKISSQSNAA